MAAINFPTATSNGQTFEADTGVIYTYVGSPPNGFWSATFATTGLTTLDNRYIAKNDGNSIQTMQTQGLKFNNGSADTILLDGVNGKVGVGTTTVDANLHVKGSYPTVHIERDHATNYSRLLLDNTANDGGAIDGIGDGVGGLRFSVSDGTAGTISEALRIDSSGNVGIGDIAPNGNYGTNLSVHSTATNGARVKISDGTTGKGNTDGLDIISTGGAAYFINRENSFMSFTVNSIEGLRIDNSGDVGIGKSPVDTNSFTKALDITGSSGAAIYVRNNAPSNSTDYGIFGYFGSDLYVYNKAAGPVRFFANAAEKMRITSSGLVNVTGGIQVTENVTATAGSGIEIFKPTSTSGQIQAFNRTSSAWMDLIIKGNTQQFHANGSERMRIDSSGRVCIGATSTTSQLRVIGNEIRFSNSSNASYYGTITHDAGTTGANIYNNVDSTTASHIWQHNGTEAMRITSSGNVGIGTSSPNDYTSAGYNTLTLNGTAGGVVDFESNGTHVGQLFNTANEFTLSSFSSVPLLLRTNGTERMRIDSLGRIQTGGSTAGVASLNIYSATLGTAVLFQNPNTGTGASQGGFVGNWGGQTMNLWNYENSSIVFGTNNTERMRITNTGKVGINTAGNTGAGLHVDNVSGTTAYGQPVIKCGSSTSWAGNGTVYSIGFGYTNGENVKVPAEIGILTTSSTGYTKGALVFATRDVTTNTAPTERMRLTSGGNLLLNRTARNYGGMLEVRFNGSVDNGLVLETTRDALNSAFLVFVDSDGNTIGSVQQNGATTVHYGTSSDYRLKENVVNLTGAIPRLKTLPVHRFNFIADSETTVDGFLAHEAQLVVPEAVTGTHNELDGDGNAVMQGIDQSKLVPLLTAALQEAIGRIETLEAEVAALKAG